MREQRDMGRMLGESFRRVKVENVSQIQFSVRDRCSGIGHKKAQKAQERKLARSRRRQSALTSRVPNSCLRTMNGSRQIENEQ